MTELQLEAKKDALLSTSKLSSNLKVENVVISLHSNNPLKSQFWKIKVKQQLLQMLQKPLEKEQFTQ